MARFFAGMPLGSSVLPTPLTTLTVVEDLFPITNFSLSFSLDGCCSRGVAGVDSFSSLFEFFKFQ